eukprot:scaffold517599_cov47-Prasinocladus_malaysianus.AAC.2
MQVWVQFAWGGSHLEWKKLLPSHLCQMAHFRYINVKGFTQGHVFRKTDCAGLQQDWYKIVCVEYNMLRDT